MYPTIKEEEIITVEPIEPSKVKKGDIILYRSEAGVVAHRVLHIIETEPSMAQPSSLSPQSLSLPTQSSVLSPHYSFTLRDDTWGATSSQIEDRQVLGKVVAVERNGCEVDPYSERARIRLFVHAMGSCIKRWMRR